MKRNQLASFVGVLGWILFGVTQSASATILASPGYFNFGGIPEGASGSIGVFFQNIGPQDDSFFSADCNRVDPNYRCESSCFGGLRPGQSCTVYVEFRPVCGNNSVVSTSIWGSGSTGLSVVDIDGTCLAHTN